MSVRTESPIRLPVFDGFHVGQREDVGALINPRYAPMGISTGFAATAFTVDNLRAVQFIVKLRRSGIINQICVEQTAAGGAGAVTRIGIYAADSNFKPGRLLFGSAAIPMDGANGIKAAACNVPVIPGQVLYLAHVSGVAASTIFSFANAAYRPEGGWGTIIPGGGTNQIFIRAFPFAALPDPSGLTIMNNTAIPLIFVRYA